MYLFAFAATLEHEKMCLLFAYAKLMSLSLLLDSTYAR